MKFLIISKNRHMIPPDLSPSIIDATILWLDKYSDKIEQSWVIAGEKGGGGIVNVESLEELDTIQSEFPLGPFTELKVYPMADLKESFNRQKKLDKEIVKSIQK
jgi:hypothetical protein